MKLTLCASLLLCLALLGNGQQTECPAPEVVDPCTCKNVAFGLHVVCADVKSAKILEITLKRIGHYQLDNLLFYGINFPDPVSESLFVGIRINVLHIESSQIKFSGLAFHGLEESLKQLMVMQCSNINDADTFKLATLNKLHELNLKNNQLHQVKNHWLASNVPNLQSLNMDNNNISSIEEHAFSTLKHLKQISLAENRITSVTRNMFAKPANNLNKIDLSHNRLEILPTDIFSDMPNLSSVVLSGNNLKSIPKATWEDIWSHVHAVFLFENEIICDGRIEWIKEQRLPQKLEGTCAAPKENKGRALKDILKT